MFAGTQHSMFNTGVVRFSLASKRLGTALACRRFHNFPGNPGASAESGPFQGTKQDPGRLRPLNEPLQPAEQVEMPKKAASEDAKCSSSRGPRRSATETVSCAHLHQICRQSGLIARNLMQVATLKSAAAASIGSSSAGYSPNLTWVPRIFSSADFSCQLEEILQGLRSLVSEHFSSDQMFQVSCVRSVDSRFSGKNCH